MDFANRPPPLGATQRDGAGLVASLRGCRIEAAPDFQPARAHVGAGARTLRRDSRGPRADVSEAEGEPARRPRGGDAGTAR